MASKRTASASDASDADIVHGTSSPSKRSRQDHDATSNEGIAAEKPILVKSEDPGSLLLFLTSSDIITIVRNHDLALIVGDQIHPQGTKAFRVNSACLSMAGEVFGGMFSGRFSESSKSEISFPDDSPDAFLIVLRIIHWQLHDLPSVLTRYQLLALAIVCDKYFLQDMANMAIHSKNWLAQHKHNSPHLPVDANIQDWILITHYLKLEDEYQYLVNSLAMNLQSSKGTSQEALYYHNDKGEKATLHTKLPESVLSMLHITIERVSILCANDPALKKTSARRVHLCSMISKIPPSGFSNLRSTKGFAGENRYRDALLRLSGCFFRHPMRWVCQSIIHTGLVPQAHCAGVRGGTGTSSIKWQRRINFRKQYLNMDTLTAVGTDAWPIWILRSMLMQS